MKKYRFELHNEYLELECLMSMIEEYLEEGNDGGAKPYIERYELIVDAIDKSHGERMLYEN